tara:strand:- start:41 stop:190 length:150 start_codon:yes stop_codon:yes gene_type:complete
MFFKDFFLVSCKKEMVIFYPNSTKNGLDVLKKFTNNPAKKHLQDSSWFC